ncbi:MAG: DMT family transporter [Zetaproteobacteria bacterium]|nr:DMT family transporter [Zetaproteobacteria bacterium]
MDKKAALYMSLSAVFSTIMGVSVKLLHSIPVLQAVLMRSVIMLLICGALLHRRGLSLWGQPRNRGLLILRGILGSLGLTCFFYTLSELAYANAVTLQYLSPLFTMLGASLFLGERLHSSWWLAACGAFLGVYLIYGVSFKIDNMAFLWGIFGALLSAAAYNCVRALNTREDPMVIMFFFPLITVPYAAIFALPNWVPPSYEQWLLLVISGIATYLLQYTLTLAYKHEKAGKVAVVGYLNVVFAVIVGTTYFEEEPSLLQLMGILTIILSIAGASVLGRKSIPKPPPSSILRTRGSLS